jgi:Mg-chelatase subunit ChlI
MKGHECYHCKQWVDEGEAHDCWTTTEAALTKDLSEDLRDAWERLRDAATDLGEQRIYASHHSIMFARKAAYFFVRPKRNHLEVVIFLGRAVKAPQIKKVVESSKIKRAHVLHLRHRDEVESPITDWLREAYLLQEQPKQANRPAGRQADKKQTVKKKAAKKKKAKKR